MAEDHKKNPPDEEDEPIEKVVRGSDSMSSVSSWVTISSSESDVENTPSTSGQGTHPRTSHNLYHLKPKLCPSRFARKSALDPCREIHAKLDRKCPFIVSLQSVRHIWNGHGHYQNAKREAANRSGKIPSYFANKKILIRRTTANVDCKCCGVLVDSRKGLVTAYPMITDDAHMQGVGQKTHLSDESSSISCDDNINKMNGRTDASITSTSSEAPSSELPDNNFNDEQSS